MGRAYLVYHSFTIIEDAIRSSYILGQKDETATTAYSLRNHVFNAHKKDTNQEWPPNVKSFNPECVLPQLLLEFLSILITGKRHITSEKQKRLVLSIENKHLPLNNSLNIPSFDFKIYLTVALGFLSSKVVSL